MYSIILSNTNSHGMQRYCAGLLLFQLLESQYNFTAAAKCTLLWKNWSWTTLPHQLKVTSTLYVARDTKVQVDCCTDRVNGWAVDPGGKDRVLDEFCDHHCRGAGSSIAGSRIYRQTSFSPCILKFRVPWPILENIRAVL